MPHITPANSAYKEMFFAVIGFNVKKLKNRYIYLFGDLNSRCATPAFNKIMSTLLWQEANQTVLQ